MLNTIRLGKCRLNPQSVTTVYPPEWIKLKRLAILSADKDVKSNWNPRTGAEQQSGLRERELHWDQKVWIPIFTLEALGKFSILLSLL